MMSNQSAFDFAPNFAERVLAVRIARCVDPKPSHLAAGEMAVSGKREGQALAVLALVRKYPCSTTRELSSRSQLTVHVIGRRLPELEKAGYIARKNTRECSVGKRLATTWQAL